MRFSRSLAIVCVMLSGASRLCGAPPGDQVGIVPRIEFEVSQSRLDLTVTANERLYVTDPFLCQRWPVVCLLCVSDQESEQFVPLPVALRRTGDCMGRQLEPGAISGRSLWIEDGRNPDEMFHVSLCLYDGFAVRVDDLRRYQTEGTAISGRLLARSEPVAVPKFPLHQLRSYSGKIPTQPVRLDVMQWETGVAIRFSNVGSSALDLFDPYQAGFGSVPSPIGYEVSRDSDPAYRRSSRNGIRPLGQRVLPHRDDIIQAPPGAICGRVHETLPGFDKQPGTRLKVHVHEWLVQNPSDKDPEVKWSDSSPVLIRKELQIR